MPDSQTVSYHLKESNQAYSQPDTFSECEVSSSATSQVLPET